MLTGPSPIHNEDPYSRRLPEGLGFKKRHQGVSFMSTRVDPEGQHRNGVSYKGVYPKKSFTFGDV